MVKPLKRSKPTLSDPIVEIDPEAFCQLKVADGAGAGTGFVFLKPAWIVTARHVVIQSHGSARSVGALFTNSGTIQAHLRYVHPWVDLAVLELERPSRCVRPLLPGDRPTGRGSLLWAGHSPSESDREHGRYTARVERVPSFKREIRERGAHKEYLIVFPTPRGEPGASGGPVIGHSGSVVAVVIEAPLINEVPHMRATGVGALLEELDLPRQS